ncbi:Lovastatin diketide synthase LovF [Cytospora mali]|uniref:Lovastatin diketide synthase LovF n=1 Tax=Cytospora mali TaxID=578113 RepID=A0A194VBM3_CYTMA|nr:Lovastatin diketide synthase LovF [Valsa mali var. pyri (nom. inval.)]
MGSISYGPELLRESPENSSMGITGTPAFEPVAIIGMAMRLPGRVHNDTDFWNFLSQKKSGLVEVPKNRFNIDGFFDPSGKPGTIPINQGFFLDDVEIQQYDTSVFPMSKKELERLDPSQWQLLQVAYECFENAGVSTWRGSSVGCYVGEFGEDWADLNAKETQHRGGYRGTGFGDFAMSNRISYEFDLRGPSMTVKTACSSSLVGLDLACEAIHKGECDSALVGGTSLIFSPTTWLALSDQELLSPRGQCRTFDASADGYARGEAVNMVLIKKLSHALRDQDPIRAIIRGTGVNSDGRTKGMLTPSPAAQAALIRRTYEAAGIADLSRTAIVECHGTGTPVGDPLEAEAVASCFGEKGVIITSVKPNVGHSEGAAGLTSLIKNVLALEHRMVLPNINFETPNPKIPFTECKLHVPTELEAWPEDRAERVSVNSFGIGGVNAHVIIESPRQFGITSPSPVTSHAVASDYVVNGTRTDGTHTNGSHSNGTHDNGDGPTGQTPSLLLLSAYSTSSLDAQIEAYREHIKNHNVQLRDVAYTLANRREHRPHRAYAVMGTSSELEPSGVQAVRDLPPRMGWVFTGQGAQWAEMGVSLIDKNATFRGTIRKLDKFLSSLPTPPPWTIEAELRKTNADSGVHRAELGHPLCVAVQVALVDVLVSWGVVPDFVLGHSSGEVAAAYASGAITAEAAMATATFRGSSNVSTDQKGSMAAVGLGRDEVLRFLEPGVDIACENSQLSTTVSGDTEAVDKMIKNLQTQQPGVFARMLRVEKAYHSHHMRQYGPSYEEHIRPYVASVDPLIPLYSSVTGKRRSGKHCLDAPYWRANMESPVLFNTALRSALKDQPGNVVLVEIGPHPALAGPIGQILRDTGRGDVVHVGTLGRGKRCEESLLHLAGRLFQQDIPMDYSVVCPPGRFVKYLPRYTWNQQTSHWAEPRLTNEWRLRENPPHELLGNRLYEITSEPTWRKVLALEDAAWLAGHEVNGQIVFPAAGYIAMVGEAIQQLTGETSISIRNVRIAAARVLEMDKMVELVTSLKSIMIDASEISPWYEFTVSSWDGTRWSRNCFGEVRAMTDKSFTPVSVNALGGPLPRRVEEESWYNSLRRIGFNYTGLFEGIRSVSSATNTTEAKAQVSTQMPGAVEGSRSSRYLLHPAAVDQCFQLFMVASSRGLGRNMNQLSVPTFIEEMVISHSTQDLYVAAQVGNMQERGSFTGDLLAQNSQGQPIISLKRLKTSALTSNQSAEEEMPLITQLEWRPHSDFVDLGACLHRRESRKREWPLLEELIVLCMLDHRERIRIDDGDTTAEHLVKFYRWMGEHIDKYLAGANQFVPKALRLEDKTSDERLSRIEQIAEALTRSPYRVFCTAIYRLFKVALSIFAGETHPLHVLLEDNVLAEFYEAASVDSSDMIRLLAHTNPHLRILEVGAGTGGTTALPDLGARERLYSVYSYTDVSAGFMTAARERFANHENIEFGVLDVAEDPAAQGFQLGSYDLIIAANVIHATSSLHTTLGNLHKLLSPGGRLFLEELSPDAMFFNYVMGYLPGWWLGAADGRVDKPWVSPERWTQELVAAGFQEPESIVLDDASPYHVNAGILVPRESRKTRPSRVTLLCHSLESHLTAEMQRSLDNQGVPVDICTFGQPLPPQQDVVSLLDLQDPILHGMSEETFKRVIRYLESHKATLLWVTRASQVSCEDPRAAMVLGLTRTARNEMSIPLLTVEVDSATAPSIAASRVVEILLRAKSTHVNPESVDPDYEYAIVNGEVLVPRLHWVTMSQAFSQHRNETELQQASVRKRLTMKTPGLLHTMSWSDASTRKLAEGEILVETKAVGLNFRDVLIALGVLENSPAEMGFEGSGIVREVGPGATRFSVGDRVMYIGSSCFTKLHPMKESLCVKMDDAMGFEQAAVMPCVYTTALLALVDKANLQKGQTILIHAAAGGVGLAAIQIAQLIGAEIYCTVGSQTKRDYLKDNYHIPDSHIFNSRDSSFLPDVLRATNQRGVDVVLNSLSGDLLTASWRCVAEFGTMVEIGKRDFQRRAKLPMEAFEANRTFTGLELRLVAEAFPHRATALLERCVEWIREGKIAGPTISTTYPAAQIQDAFRHMQMAKHIGKIVVSMPECVEDLQVEVPGSTVVVAPKPRPVFRSDRTYLLVGGLGGLGRALATWMAENGACSLVFLSRSARAGPGTDGFVEELHSLGCQVLLVAGSVMNRADVNQAVENALTATRPMAGVINLSMVLKDIGLSDMTFADWNTAVQPKVQGTWHLHEATATADLDFFILFSSYGSIAGQWGQANYAAANTFMDAFVQFRHHKGLVASVIDVGVMGEIGFVSRNQDVLDRLNRIGMHILQENDLLDAVALAVSRSKPSSPATAAVDTTPGSGPGRSTYTNPSQVLLGLNTSIPISSPLNRVAWRRDVRMSIYHNLERRNGGPDPHQPADRNSLRGQLASLSEQDDKRGVVARVLAGALANFLIKDEDSIALDRPLENLGVDSLVAMEVRNWVRQQVGVELSTITIVQSPSLLHLADQVQVGMKGSEDGGVAEKGQAVATEEDVRAAGA